MKIALPPFIVGVVAVVRDMETEGPELMEHVRTSAGVKRDNCPKLLVHLFSSNIF